MSSFDFTKVHPSLLGEGRKPRQERPDPRGMKDIIKAARKAKRSPPRIECTVCDELFIPQRYWQEFCSDKCRFTFHNKAKAQARKEHN